MNKYRGKKIFNIIELIAQPVIRCDTRDVAGELIKLSNALFSKD